MIIHDGQGNEHELDSISAFAREYGLERSLLSRVVNGRRYHHRGWHLPHVSLIKELVDPDGNTHRFYSQAAFCREHGLDKDGVSRLLNGNISQHRGWTRK